MFRVFNFKSTGYVIAETSNTGKSNIPADAIAFTRMLEEIYKEVKLSKDYGFEISDLTFPHIFVVELCQTTEIVSNEYRFNFERFAVEDLFGNLASHQDFNSVKCIALKLKNLMNVKQTITKKQNVNPKRIIQNTNKPETQQPKKNNESKQELKKEEVAPNKNIKETLGALLNDTAKLLSKEGSTIKDREIRTVTDTEEKNRRLREKYGDKKPWRDQNDDSDEEGEKIGSDELSDNDSIGSESSSTYLTSSDEDDEDNLSPVGPDDDEETKKIKNLYFEMKKQKVAKEQEVKEKEKHLDNDLKNFSRYVEEIGNDKREIKRMEDRLEERKRVYESDKVTFMRIMDQIIESNGEFNETSENFPKMFIHKWSIFRFMAENGLLDKENNYQIYLILFNSVHNPVTDKDYAERNEHQFFNTHTLNYIDEGEEEVFKLLKEKHSELISKFKSMYVKEHKLESREDILNKLKKQMEEQGIDMDDLDTDNDDSETANEVDEEDSYEEVGESETEDEEYKVIENNNKENEKNNKTEDVNKESKDDEENKKENGDSNSSKNETENINKEKDNDKDDDKDNVTGNNLVNLADNDYETNKEVEVPL